MKCEITLDDAKEKELFEIINKRLDGMKIPSGITTKKALVQYIMNKALNKDDVLTSTLKNMSNGEFFELIKNC